MRFELVNRMIRFFSNDSVQAEERPMQRDPSSEIRRACRLDPRRLEDRRLLEEVREEYQGHRAQLAGVAKKTT